MRVGIDCSCVAKPERTGVARYCASLIHALPAAIGADDRVSLLYRASRLRRRRHFERVDDPRFSLSLFHDKVVSISPARLDVVHGPDLRLPRFRSTPAVSTVHDLSALDLPGIARESFIRRKQQALTELVRRASVVLCISAFTESALLRHQPELEGRTRIVPLGLGPQFRPCPADEVARVRTRFGLPERYLLFVGQIAARKNLGTLLDAFVELGGDPCFEDVHLVLVGPVQSGGDEILARAAASGVRERIDLPGYVGDAELPALYSGAAAFCFTGKAEGFCLPILEAMACGSPVVAARAGAVASTAGGAALLVPPDDPGAVAAVLRDILGDDGVRADLVAAGREHAARFTWAETARATVAAYRDAIELGVPA